MKVKVEMRKEGREEGMGNRRGDKGWGVRIEKRK